MWFYTIEHNNNFFMILIITCEIILLTIVCKNKKLFFRLKNISNKFFFDIFNIFIVLKSKNNYINLNIN